MADYKQGSRYTGAKFGTFSGKTVVFPKYTDPRSLTFAKFIEIEPGDEYREDLISLKAYGRDDLGWIIMMANDIDHPKDLRVGKQLGVPRVRGIL